MGRHLLSSNITNIAAATIATAYYTFNIQQTFTNRRWEQGSSLPTPTARLRRGRHQLRPLLQPHGTPTRIRGTNYGRRSAQGDTGRPPSERPPT